jgi:hypothetical protein
MPLAQAQINPQPTLGVAPIDTADAWFSAGDVMNVILVLVVIGIGISIWRAQRDKENRFNLFDLIMDEGRLSLLKCMAGTGFAVYTWAVIRWIITGSVTTQDMREYAIACIAPVLVAIISNAKARGQRPLQEAEPKSKESP